MPNLIKAAIIGASGYTGCELIRLIQGHPEVEITALVANSNAGQPIDLIYPHLANYGLPDLISLQEISWKEVDVAFCCLPHGTSQEVIAGIPHDIKIIDLSADFRIFDTEIYAKWYGGEHRAPELQENAVYGLTELFQDEIKNARLVACPGCYPTSALLPLAPLMEAGAIQPGSVIIDSKSGVSGAGRSVKQSTLFCEVNEGVEAYNTCNHRHIPEIEQLLSWKAGTDVHVHFSPHIVPMSRGILSTIYVQPAQGHNVESIRQTLEHFYQSSSFVHITPVQHIPYTRKVTGSNRAFIGICAGRTEDTVVLVSVIDNLIKGASGQALQNMNIMFGLDETIGLEYIPVFP